MLMPTPYKPYAPPGQSGQKAYAGLRGNQVQSKIKDYAASVYPAQYGGTTIGQQYGWPAIQNPPYYQVPTPPNAINEAKALADTPEPNKQYARDVINAYKQFLGRLPDEPGYMAHLQRAVAEKADWNKIADWLRNSEEGQRYRAMRDVGLQIEPEISSRHQEYQRWLAEQEYQKRYLQEQLRQALQRQQLDYSSQLEDLARAIIERQGAARNEMVKRGVWQSGIMDAALQKIAEQEALARGRLGSEYQAAIGNLMGTYGTNLGALANRMGLYGQQFNESMADLMRRREGLISQALDKLLEQREQEEWRQRMFDWEREKWLADYALRRAALNRSYGGGGYGYGGGGGGGSGPDAMDKFIEQAKLIIDQGGNLDDVVNIFDQAFYGGGRPGLDTRGMDRDDWYTIKKKLYEENSPLLGGLGQYEQRVRNMFNTKWP